jgi:hypothetical protein
LPRTLAGFPLTALKRRKIEVAPRSASLWSCAARESKRQSAGKCEGRRTRIDRALNSGDAAGARRLEEAIALAKRLHRASPKTGERMSLRKISAELAAADHVNERGEPYHPQSVRYMLDQR